MQPWLRGGPAVSGRASPQRRRERAELILPLARARRRFGRSRRVNTNRPGCRSPASRQRKFRRPQSRSPSWRRNSRTYRRPTFCTCCAMRGRSSAPIRKRRTLPSRWSNLRTLAQLARPGEDVSEDFDKLVKGLEIKGVTQHPEQFQEYMEGIAKGINVFGDTLRPYEYYEMFKYGRQASAGLSEKFILGTGPTLAQELGGEGFGAAVAQFNRLLVSGVGKKGSFEELARLGLIDKSDVANIPGTGEGQGLKSGRTVAGWQLAQSDPNEWVKQYLLPAFDKAGIKDKDEQLREIGVLFQSQRAGQLVDLLATQQPRIEKDTALLAHAQGLSAADLAIHQDPGLAWQGLKSSIDSLVGTTGESVRAADLLTQAAQALSRYTEGLTKESAAQAKGAPSPGDRGNSTGHQPAFVR